MSDRMMSKANHPSARSHFPRWEEELRQQQLDDEAIALANGIPLPAQPWLDGIIAGFVAASLTAAVATFYWYGGTL